MAEKTNNEVPVGGCRPFTRLPSYTAWTTKKKKENPWTSIVGGVRARDPLQLCDKSSWAAVEERRFCVQGKKEEAFNSFLDQTLQSNGRWKACQLHTGTALTLVSLPNMHFARTTSDQLVLLAPFGWETKIFPERLKQSGEMQRRCRPTLATNSQTFQIYFISIS